jgi:DNA-binding GntR family transcriptional regulator
MSVFCEEFDAPTLTLEQYVEPSKFDSEICALLGLPSGSVGVVLHTTGRSVGQEAMTYQSLWMPAGNYMLEIAAGRNRPTGS